MPSSDKTQHVTAKETYSSNVNMSGNLITGMSLSGYVKYPVTGNVTSCDR